MNVEQQILRIVSEQFNFGNTTPTLSTRFVADLGFDSLDSVEFVMELEDEFAVEIDDEQAERCTTVADAASLITQLLEQQA